MRTDSPETSLQVVETFQSKVLGYEVVHRNGMATKYWMDGVYDDLSLMDFADHGDGELGNLIIGQGDIRALEYQLQQVGIGLREHNIGVPRIEFTVHDAALLRRLANSPCVEIVVQMPDDTSRAVALLTVDGSIDSTNNRVLEHLSLVAADEATIRRSIGSRLARAGVPTVDFVDGYDPVSALRHQVEIEICTSDRNRDVRISSGLAVLCDLRTLDRMLLGDYAPAWEILSLATSVFVCGLFDIEDIRNLEVLEALPTRARLFRVVDHHRRDREHETVNSSIFGPSHWPRFPLTASSGLRP